MKGVKKQELKTELTLIENEFKKLVSELNDLSQVLLEGECHKSNYITACNELQYEYNNKVKNICYKSIRNIINFEINRTTELSDKKYNEKCDDISLMPFKCIYLADKMVINLSPMGSKWTTKLVSKVNPKDNTEYERYITTIEADPVNGLGSKINHEIIEKIGEKGTSIYGADWLYIETDKPLIKNEMTFAFSDDSLDDNLNDSLDNSLCRESISAENIAENKVEINEPVLSFGYQIQKGYKSPVYYNFPKDIYFMKNRFTMDMWGRGIIWGPGS